MNYSPDSNRYQHLRYKKTGDSGLKLPPLSLGLWHNFGDVDDFENARSMVEFAFDQGITHFDLANNYGPPPGSAESNFGKILDHGMRTYRDELVISTKAGYSMWDGPYQDGGSRKYLISSLDQSLKRMHLDYVDIFYHHRPDAETPLEETMSALHQITRAGKALYIGLSNYPPQKMRKAAEILTELGTPLIIHQPKYNMFHRDPENGLLDLLNELNLGCIPFSPLAQGLLTEKYVAGIPEQSRMAKKHGNLDKNDLTKPVREKLRRLRELARSRDLKLSQMAIKWIQRHEVVTSVLAGVSSKDQIRKNIEAVNLDPLDAKTLAEIETILTSEKL